MDDNGHHCTVHLRYNCGTLEWVVRAVIELKRRCPDVRAVLAEDPSCENIEVTGTFVPSGPKKKWNARLLIRAAEGAVAVTSDAALAAAEARRKVGRAVS